MKKQKSVKKLLKKNGLSNFDNYSPIIGYNSGISNVVLIYNDLSSNTYYQITSNPTGLTQLFINATPSAITWESGGTLSTQQISVVNNYGINVISNCVFVSSNINVVSVNTTGLITEVGAGTTTIIVKYQDPTYDTLVLTDKGMIPVAEISNENILPFTRKG